MTIMPEWFDRAKPVLMICDVSAKMAQFAVLRD